MTTANRVDAIVVASTVSFVSGALDLDAPAEMERRRGECEGVLGRRFESDAARECWRDGDGKGELTLLWSGEDMLM